MKKFILYLKFVFILSFLSVNTNAQSISNYVFSTGTNASLARTYGSLIDDIDMSTGTFTHVGGTNNIGYSQMQNINFDFWMYGFRNTQFNATSHGMVGIGQLAYYTYTFLMVNARYLEPFLASSNLSMGTSDAGNIRSKVIGTAPSRVLVIQFKNMAINASVADDSITFQARIYENTGMIEYVYGVMRVDYAPSPVTFNSAFQVSNTIYQNVNHSTMTSSSSSSSGNTYTTTGPITNFTSSTNGSRRYVRWIPNAPNDPTGLNITNLAPNSMRLNWTDASNETAYGLYRSADGGVTYTWMGLLPANSNTTLQAGLSPNTTYYWRLYSIRESVGNPVDVVGTTLTANKVISIATGNWNTGTTWSGGAVPVSTDSVEISLNDTVTIDISGSTALDLLIKGRLIYGNGTYTTTIFGNVTVEPTGSFIGGSSTGQVLNIGGNTAASTANGNLVVQGVFDLNTVNPVTIAFYGATNASISGNGTIDLGTLTVNKGNSQSYFLDINSTFTQAPAIAGAPRLNLTNGTLKINAALNISPFVSNSFWAAGFNTTRLWLNHTGINLSTVGITTNSNGYIYFPQGTELRIDNGTLNAGAGCTSCSPTGANILYIYGLLTMNGGTLNVNGSIQTGGGTNNNFVISGGNINIKVQGAGWTVPTGNPAFTLQSNAGLNWSNGTVTITDPHTAAGGTSINFLAGGTKIISGGLLRIGDGISTLASGLPISGTSGFAINSTTPFYNVEINNRYNSANSRFCRIVGTLTVQNNLNIKSGAYLFLGNGAPATASTLVAIGPLVNDGIIAGNVPGTAGQFLGTLSFEKSASGFQNVSGIGITQSMDLLQINSTATAFFSNTTAWVFNRVKMLQGGIAASSSNIIYGSATAAPIVQIGGLGENVAAAMFAFTPGFNNAAGLSNYIYAPNSLPTTMGFYGEIPTAAANIGTLLISDADGLTSNGINVNVVNLSLQGGDFNIGDDTLTIGTSNINPGSITTTTSAMVTLKSGLFKRWYNNTSIPLFGFGFGFPVKVNGLNSSLQINASALFNTGGTITFKHNRIPGFTNIASIADAGVNINRRSNSSWTLTTGNGLNLGSANLIIKLFAQGIGSVSSVAALRFCKANGLAGGTNINGTGTIYNPEINRNFTQANINQISDVFYLGADSINNSLAPTYTAIATGNWNDPATWDANAVPGINNNVLIPAPYVVTIPNSAGTWFRCDSLTILSGGYLVASGSTNNGLYINRSIYLEGTLTSSGTIITVNGNNISGINIAFGGVLNSNAGGNFNVGPLNGGNRLFEISGTLNISGGIVKLGGYCNLNASGTLIQTGGLFSLDPNSGLVNTSTTTGIHILNLNSSNINCSAGSILFVDPPFSAISVGSTHTLRITALATLSAFTGTHTVQFGDGISPQMGNANGFCVDTKRNGVVPLQNVIVNGGTEVGRWTSPSFSSGSFGMHVQGSLTINSGSELRHINACQFAIGGNLVNNGIFTSANVFTLGGLGYIISAAQTISGNGVYNNSATTPTASFASLVMDNIGGISLNTTSQTFSYSGTLTLSNGTINTNSNNIRINAGASILRTNGYINGTLNRNIVTGTNVSTNYFLGSATDYLPVTILFPSVATSGFVSVSNYSGDHAQILSSCFDANKTANRNWSIANNGALPSNYGATFNFASTDVDASANTSNFRVQRFDGSNWNNTSLVATTATSTQINNITSNGSFQIGEYAPATPTVTINSTSTSICLGTTVTFTAASANGGNAPTYQWKKNTINVGTNSNTFVDNTLANGDQITCNMVSNSNCVSSFNASSNAITMSVSNSTISGSVGSDQTICSGNSPTTLNLTGQSGNVLRWESSLIPFTTWNIINNTTTNYSGGSLTQTTAFRAVLQSGVCPTGNSNFAIVAVDQTSVGGSINGTTSICSGSNPGVLSLSGYIGTIVRWESSVSPFTAWTTIANTNNTYSPGTLTQTTSYRAVIQSGSCSAANSVALTVTVSSAIGGTVSGGNSICSGSAGGTLTLSGYSGSVINWESAVSPFTTWSNIINTTATLSPGVLTQTTYYRAVVQNGTCGTATSSIDSIRVTSLVVGGSINGPTGTCSGSNPGALNLTGHIGNVTSWESSVSPFTTWTPISNTTTSYSPGVLSQTTQFRANVQSGTCGSATSSVLVINVTSTVTGGSVTGVSTVCSGTSPGTLVLSGYTGSVTSWLSSTSPFTTWSVISNTNPTYNPGILTVASAFRAIVQSGTCGTDTSTALTINITSASNGGSVSGSATICFGSSSGTMSLSGNNGSILRWESSVNPFTSWTSISNTTSNYTSGALFQTTHFRAVVSNGVCPEAPSSIALINVNPAGLWLGATSSNWNDGANWCGGVPSTSAVINSGTPFAPIISSTASINNILLGPSASLTVASGGILFLGAAIIFNSGSTFNATNGTVNFNGTIAQTIPQGNYNVLGISGGGNKSLAGNVAVLSSLNLSSAMLILGAFDLTIDASASITGASSNSFAVTNGTGRLTQNNIGSSGRTGSILFPVGSSTNSNTYVPVSINNTGTSDNFSARVFNSVYNNYSGQTPIGGALASDAVNMSWFVSEATAGGSNTSLSFQWDASQELSSFTNNSCYAAQYNGTQWMKGTTSAASGSNPYTQTLSGITSFAVFGVGSNGALPVKLISFNAIKKGSNVEVIWKTAQEINNAKFEVERSYDAINFIKINEVLGAINSNQIQDYFIVDKTANLKNKVYYRLKQIDLDGQFAYSKTVSINADSEKLENIKAVPNPFNENTVIKFNIATETKATIILTNLLGKIIGSSTMQTVSGDNEFTINNTFNLAAGIYFVRVETSSNTQVIKIIKE